MKKRIILYCLLVVFISLLGASLFLMKQKQDFNRKIAVIPEFCLPRVVDSMLFCSMQLLHGNPVVLMYMHSECEFCQTEAQQIRQKLSSVENIQWVLISYAEKDSLQKFMETYQLSDVPELVMLMDSEFELHDRLKVKSIPTSYVYNRQLQLVTVLPGAVSIEKLIQLAIK